MGRCASINLNIFHDDRNHKKDGGTYEMIKEYYKAEDRRVVSQKGILLVERHIEVDN